MDDTFNPASLTRLDTSGSVNGTKNISAAPKSAKASTNFPRVDLEPIYTELKDAIGHRWDIYFDAITRFTRGELHQREFGDLTDEIIYASDNILHSHNKFICAIAFNSTRDSPEPGIAAWVTAAADKSAATGSGKATVTSDAGEQRLKKEVMAIHARDRRRLKNMGTDGDGKAKPEDEVQRRNQYEESYAASKYKVPEAIGAGSGLTKTNWEPEIKKRYAQPLFAESSEFPDAATIFARMVPICYEEAIPQGSNMVTAELVVNSAEYFLKDLLSTIFERVRSNGPRDENSVTGNGHDGIFGGGVFTARYKKQVAKELELVKDDKLQRTKDDDLLPVESAVAKARRPLGVNDFKLANRVGPSLWKRTPLLGFELTNRPSESEYDDWKAEQEAIPVQTNGHVEDHMDVDDDSEWEGYGADGVLDELLDECLAMPV